jgi:hypothetical protein
MATFTKMEQLTDHAKYKPLLKAALAKVKGTPLRFTYFEKYKFGDKTFPLMLVDFDAALVTEVKKKIGNTTAIGKCRLNHQDELVFESESGRLNRAKLKRYLATFTGVKHVWVPSGEESGEEESEERQAPPSSQASKQSAQESKKASAAELTGAFNRMLPSAKQAAADHPEQKTKITEAMLALQNFIKAGALEDAAKALNKVAELMDALRRPSSETKTSGGDRSAALAAWQAARNQVMGGLKQLENKIRAMNDPEGDPAIILLRAIQANLPANPSTLQQAAELERYLNADSIITDAESPNGFGIKIEIRKPLLAALGKLKSQMPA